MTCCFELMSKHRRGPQGVSFSESQVKRGDRVLHGDRLIATDPWPKSVELNTGGRLWGLTSLWGLD